MRRRKVTEGSRFLFFIAFKGPVFFVVFPRIVEIGFADGRMAVNALFTFLLGHLGRSDRNLGKYESQCAGYTNNWNQFPHVSSLRLAVIG